MSAAYSRKQRRQRSRPYLRIRPRRLLHTRLPQQRRTGVARQRVEREEGRGMGADGMGSARTSGARRARAPSGACCACPACLRRRGRDQTVSTGAAGRVALAHGPARASEGGATSKCVRSSRRGAAAAASDAGTRLTARGPSEERQGHGRRRHRHLCPRGGVSTGRCGRCAKRVGSRPVARSGRWRRDLRRGAERRRRRLRGRRRRPRRRPRASSPLSAPRQPTRSPPPSQPPWTSPMLTPPLVRCSPA